jgi:hypothetical protein
MYIPLLPADKEEREIARQWKSGETEAAAALLDLSSLEGETRQGWYDKVLVSARAKTDSRRRAALLAGVAKCLKDENPAESIVVLWEALELVKPFNPRRGYHDVHGYLGPTTPPANPDEALSSTFVDFRGGGQPAIDALWEFAHKLESADEREPLLEALGKVLAEQKKFPQAAGLITLLSSPTRQAQLWVEIAAEQHGIAYADRR